MSGMGGSPRGLLPVTPAWSQLRACEPQVFAWLNLYKVERAGTATCLMERTAKELELPLNIRREAAIPPRPMSEETVHRLDAFIRREPPGIEVPFVEVHVPQIRQLPHLGCGPGR